MRLLITGGTGLLGGALATVAAARGHAVTATHHEHAPTGSQVSWRPLDLTDRVGVRAVVGGARPDAVIHTAYRQGEPGLRAVTTEGALHVAEAARDAGARLVHLSTDVVFDGEREGAYTEDDAVAPVTDYGRAKADAERMVLAAHPDAVSVRTSLLYTLSPDDRQYRLALDLAEGRAQGALFTDEIRCPVLVAELVEALLELAAHPYRGALHLAGSDALSRHAFGALLLRHHGGDPAGIPAARSADLGARRPRNCALSSERARGLLRTRLRGARAVLGG